MAPYCSIGSLGKKKGQAPATLLLVSETTFKKIKKRTKRKLGSDISGTRVLEEGERARGMRGMWWFWIGKHGVAKY
jgi:hypothetical protein